MIIKHLLFLRVHDALLLFDLLQLGLDLFAVLGMLVLDAVWDFAFTSVIRPGIMESSRGGRRRGDMGVNQ